jgi:hypothetical protein
VYVAPSFDLDPQPGAPQHRSAHVDAHDAAGGADRPAQVGKAQAGAASHVQRVLARLEVQGGDGLGAQPREEAKLQSVVHAREHAVTGLRAARLRRRRIHAGYFRSRMTTY